MSKPRLVKPRLVNSLVVNAVVVTVSCLTQLVPAQGQPLQAIANTWSDVDRIVAIGDVHGDYDQFLKALRASNLIDNKMNWSGGKTHLVQTGDVFDRGPDSKKALDLLMSLERQALLAGGMVHTLLGNHEVMVMMGDVRYTHPEEIESFGGRVKLAAAVGPQGKYGSWLRTHNCIIKINDILFMHGGLSLRWSKLSLNQLNDDARTLLRTRGVAGHPVEMDGPLWHRDWALNRGAALAALCDPVFKKFGVKHAVIGHTPQSGVVAFGGGRVICVDTGMSARYGGPATALVIEKGVYRSLQHGKPPRQLDVDYD